ncbi:hypothetical protein K438DRAFT_1845750 [Mycena galopus ATCC 62051]|nr:hypothetical protein K438DRAFT_1845750 [Mycena galopus ATCC 62051]
MNPLQVPELLQQIALFAGESPQSLSSLAQIDRSTHAAVTPSLFRNITVRLESVDSLALALRNTPQRALLCKSLSFCCGKCQYQEGMGPALDDDVLQKLCTNLVAVLRAISAHGSLLALRWTLWTYNNNVVELSGDVWNALSSVLGSVQELDVCILGSEDLVWGALTRTNFTQLRVFRLEIGCSQGWEDEGLKSMLDALYDLEELVLQLPQCCGPEGVVFLHSAHSHPHLKRLSFTSSDLLYEGSDFLAQFPEMEVLSLDTEQQFRGPFPKILRALNADTPSLSFSPALLDCHLTHLRLRETNGHPDGFEVSALRALERTLRCFELEVWGIFDAPIPPHVIPLLQTARALDELAIIRPGPVSPSPPNWSSDVLNVLAFIDPATPLRALRIRSRAALPQERLLDLGPLPPQLKYIGWDFQPDEKPRPTSTFYVMNPQDNKFIARTIPVDLGYTSLVYVIEKQDDKNIVARTITRLDSEDWMTQSVLPFMGESWTP